MTLRLYNTLTRKVESFVPITPGRVSMYTCGPTVWNYAHIGNFRTFAFEDLLRRWLEASGFEVFHIMNLTDVDDRIIKEAGSRGTTISEFVAPFVAAFYEDRDYLRLRPAHEYPRATEFIAPMVRMVEGLLANGTAYKGEDGSVYFSISRFPPYGRLSQLDRRELKAGASERGGVSTDEYAKEDARDFALWKAAKPEDEAAGAAWDAPFGRGRPGWHLECSAMALELLHRRYGVEVLDLHAGGVDLIFPHHEDELAQSCAYTGQPDFARYWVHGEFLNLKGAKMSKRFGNLTTPRDLRADGVDPGAIRLLFFQTHYRQKLDLTDDALEAATRGSRRLGEFRDRLMATRGNAVGASSFAGLAERLEGEFRAALDDDLNAPRAVAALYDFVSEGNRLLDGGHEPGPALHRAWQLADTVLDVCPRESVRHTIGEVLSLEESADLSLTPSDRAPEDPAAAQTWATTWAHIRRNEKAHKNFAEADRIRGLLQKAGFEVRDNRDGSMEIRRI